MENYESEYAFHYGIPYVEQKIVGFSGIDPSISDEEIHRAITQGMNSGKIKFDAGEIK